MPCWSHWMTAAERNVRPASQRLAGATDEDLPRLFKAIDAQVDVLAQRYHVLWSAIEED